MSSTGKGKGKGRGNAPRRSSLVSSYLSSLPTTYLSPYADERAHLETAMQGSHSIQGILPVNGPRETAAAVNYGSGLTQGSNWGLESLPRASGELYGAGGVYLNVRASFFLCLLFFPFLFSDRTC